MTYMAGCYEISGFVLCLFNECLMSTYLYFRRYQYTVNRSTILYLVFTVQPGCAKWPLADCPPSTCGLILHFGCSTKHMLRAKVVLAPTYLQCKGLFIHFELLALQLAYLTSESLSI